MPIFFSNFRLNEKGIQNFLKDGIRLASLFTFFYYSKRVHVRLSSSSAVSPSKEDSKRILRKGKKRIKLDLVTKSCSDSILEVDSSQNSDPTGTGKVGKRGQIPLPGCQNWQRRVQLYWPQYLIPILVSSLLYPS